MVQMMQHHMYILICMKPDLSEFSMIPWFPDSAKPMGEYQHFRFFVVVCGQRPLSSLKYIFNCRCSTRRCSVCFAASSFRAARYWDPHDWCRSICQGWSSLKTARWRHTRLRRRKWRHLNKLVVMTSFTILYINTRQGIERNAVILFGSRLPDPIAVIKDNDNVQQDVPLSAFSWNTDAVLPPNGKQGNLKGSIPQSDWYPIETRRQVPMRTPTDHQRQCTAIIMYYLVILIMKTILFMVYWGETSTESMRKHD